MAEGGWAIFKVPLEKHYVIRVTYVMYESNLISERVKWSLYKINKPFPLTNFLSYVGHDK